MKLFEKLIEPMAYLEESMSILSTSTDNKHNSQRAPRAHF